MELKKILQGIDGIKAKGDLSLDVKDITNDSRKVNIGSMFVAIKGFDADGHSFLKDVIAKKPSAILVEEGADLKEITKLEDITVLVVKDTRKALSIISSNFYDNPAKKLKIIGVTGTKGKTTTTYMIKEMLEKQGKKVRINWNYCCLY
jgi:UDP-N-acetylmuramoyl-L-alanyl-D-glutamate--2,6-diaminopimelate ligase